MKKRVYLKSWVESLLTNIVLLSIMFIAISIESIGNSTYNKILIITIIIDTIIMKVLSCYGKDFIENNK